MVVVPLWRSPRWQLNLMVHCAPDALPVLHFHGGRLVSLILWGGYTEERFDLRTGQADERTHHPLTVNHIRTRDAHRLVGLRRRVAVTLHVLFPDVQEGGFLVDGEFASFGRALHEGHLTSVR